MKNPKEIKIDDFVYALPDERIAKYPLPKRDESKLLIYNKGKITESIFNEVPKMLAENELVVFNNTKVIQARLHFKKQTGALIEIFCLEPASPNDYVLSFQQNKTCTWYCLIGNLKKWKGGVLEHTLVVGNVEVTLFAELKSQHNTSFEVQFSWNNEQITFSDILESFGELPIPPYLNRKTESRDNETYQTVYSKIKGSVAAPTAGLHFTESVLNDLRRKNIDLQEVTLHVGAGTFRPVKSEYMEQHDMHTEYISVSRQTIEALLAHKCEVLAVGTTSVRTIESLYYIGAKLLNQDIANDLICVKQWEPYEVVYELTPQESLQSILDYMQKNNLTVLNAATQIIIAPSYEFHFVKKMITNFHQPKSTLLLLVSAFVGGDWKKVYDYALTHDFRFLSYGDSSLLMP
ncbi:MAG: S-adenosylmethionine:tRNA ribosyltransferase-isomerase [Paludibacteraceae bacterium]|nr:S-adenosylmethionine:tRNA ribosyltransferase-isomerase [Paludibacteraceae bacterium]